MKVLLLAIVLALVWVAGATAAPKVPVVSGLDYQDKPLYDDQSFMGVTFKTSRPASPGYTYGIVLDITGKNAVVGECSSVVFSWDPKFGGSAALIRSAGTHSKILKGTRYGYFCRGSASLTVVEHKIGGSAIGRYLGDGSEIRFRVDAAP